MDSCIHYLIYIQLLKDCTLAAEEKEKPTSRLIKEGGEGVERRQQRGVPVMMTVQPGLGGSGNYQ
jgi:hypothetical protein